MTESESQRFDVVVVGLGAFGSAAACYLARRGLSVCGIDRHSPPHDQGSSHGASRIIREAYAEDPLYVPWLQRSYELWDELEELTGENLLTRCGGLMIGHPETELVEGARASAREHALESEVLSPAEVMERWPGIFHLPPGTVASFDRRAGVLKPEACIEAFLGLAAEAGADLRLGTPVKHWTTAADGVEIELDGGVTVAAKRLVLAAGAWISELAPAIAPHLQVARQIMHWFAAPADGAPAGPHRMPIFVWEHDTPRIFYGFPDEGEGIKVAIHHDGELTSVDAIDRDVAQHEVEEVRELLTRYLPDLSGEWLRSEVCMYTNTPDGHFLVDRHPDHPEVILASACSGHGFKFSAALGEAIADLAEDLEPRTSLAAFRLGRFDEPPASLTRVRTGAARFSGKLRRS